MIDKNKELNAWKDQHCNNRRIKLIGVECHDRKYPEVIYSDTFRCTGCPYYIEERRKK